MVQVELDDVEWGDVVVDTGDVLVVEARHQGDQVLVKRWGGGVLDGELAARRELAAAGVASSELRGGGEGWLVVDDLAETMWRAAGEDDLGQPGVLRALGAWFAQVHSLPGGALGGDPMDAVWAPALLELAAVGLPDDLADRLVPAVAGWRETLAGEPSCLVVDAFSLSEVRVMGDGLDAMPTDLSLCRRGCAATDLALVREVLQALGDDQAWQLFCQAYRERAGRQVDDQALAAASGLRTALPVVVPALSGQPVAEGALVALRAALPG